MTKVVAMGEVGVANAETSKAHLLFTVASVRG